MLPFSILVLFAQLRLGTTAEEFGLMLAASAVVGLLRSGIAARIRLRSGYRKLIVASLLLGATSLRQRLVPNELRGRVTAASRILGLLGLALSTAAGGFLGSADVTLPMLVGGAVFVAGAALALVFVPKKEALAS